MIPHDILLHDRTHNGTVTLVWVAIWFGLVSLPGALYLIPGIRETPLFGIALAGSNLAPFTATISWILALIAAATSGVRLIRRPRTKNSKKAFLMAAPGAVLGAVALGFVVYSVGSMLGAFQPNEAEAAGKAGVEHYLDQGASLICDNGNNGHGVNSTPWYDAFIDAPEELGTAIQARDALALAGHPDTESPAMPEYYNLPASSKAIIVRSLDVYKNSAVGAPDISRATIVVYPDSEVSLSCYTAGGDYGDDVAPKAGRVIIHLSLQLEKTR